MVIPPGGWVTLLLLQGARVPEKVPEKTPGEWLTKLSMTAPGCLNLSEGDGARLLHSLKVGAVAGIWGPGLEPLGAGVQTGVAA